MSKLNLATYVDCTEVEGPGRRFSLWVQGCNKRCCGCCNPDFWDFIPRQIVDSDEICAAISHAKTDTGIEGVTFLGGEPMLQAKGLSDVARFCHDLALSVMVFTGYTFSELSAAHLPYVKTLLRFTDVLVDGAFEKSNLETERNWVGSRNQRFHFLTTFYQSGIEYDSRYSHGFELRVCTDCTIQTNGFPWQVVKHS